MESRGQCKVDVAIDRYDIDAQRDEFGSIDEELLALWKGETDRDPQGYRSLAEWFNKQLLRNAYEANDRFTMGSRLTDEYETLTGDDDIARAELVDELEADGIDGRKLRSDMVSFSTIRRHLTTCLDGEKERKPARTNWEKESVDIAMDQLRDKIDKALSSYETKDRIPGATEANVSIQVQLSCPECPTRRTLSDALRSGYVCEDHLGSNAGGEDRD